MKLKLTLAALCCVALLSKSFAETIVVTGSSGLNEKPIPVNLSGFSGEALEVIQFDLTVQGFSFVSTDAAQYLLSGSGDANLVGRAQDRINKSYLVNKSYSGASVRKQAHAFVDDFLAALGRKGIGGTKVAFKRDTGASSELCIADFDGAGAQNVTPDKGAARSPAWVPGKFALCYVSDRTGDSHIYHHDLASGRRTDIAPYPGSNLSPAVSPNGQNVAMILSKSGAVDLYVGDVEGGSLKRLTKSRDDESSPCWSPNGEWICFAGKIEGKRALYKIPAAGGSPTRIPTGVANPTEPDWSPDGKWIAFTQQRRGGFDICVVPAGGGQAEVKAEGEDPSWAPNSRTVIYARREGSGKRLSMLDVPTKQTKTISRISGNNSQPSWAK